MRPTTLQDAASIVDHSGDHAVLLVVLLLALWCAISARYGGANLPRRVSTLGWFVLLGSGIAWPLVDALARGAVLREAFPTADTSAFRDFPPISASAIGLGIVLLLLAPHLRAPDDPAGDLDPRPDLPN